MSGRPAPDIPVTATILCSGTAPVSDGGGDVPAADGGDASTGTVLGTTGDAGADGSAGVGDAQAVALDATTD
jgi:hypothetical protein